MRNIRTILDEVYDKYNKETNMTASQLISWSKNPLSKKASLNRKPIIMAIKLKSKPKTKWNITDVKWALRKAIPYLKRAKRIKSKNKISKKYTKNQVALKNWGFDVMKKSKFPR